MTQPTYPDPTPGDGLFIHPRPLSDLLLETASEGGERVSVEELALSLSARGFAPLILLMALLNIFTIIPGSSTVMGLPLIFMGIAVILNSRKLWLPRRLARASMSRALLLKGVLRAKPWLERIERLVRPRFWPRGGWVLDRLYGILVTFFAVLITMPIAFANTMPAITIILLSLGFAGRDGIWVVAGLIAGTVAIGILVGVIATLILGANLIGW